MTKSANTTAARAPSTAAQASLYQTLRGHLAVLKLDPCAEALPGMCRPAWPGSSLQYCLGAGAAIPGAYQAAHSARPCAISVRYQRVAFSVTDGVLTLPRQYFGCLGITVEEWPRPIYNHWYEFVGGGPGFLSISCLEPASGGRILWHGADLAAVPAHRTLISRQLGILTHSRWSAEWLREEMGSVDPSSGRPGELRVRSIPMGVPLGKEADEASGMDFRRRHGIPLDRPLLRSRNRCPARLRLHRLCSGRSVCPRRRSAPVRGLAPGRVTPLQRLLRGCRSNGQFPVRRAQSGRRVPTF